MGQSELSSKIHRLKYDNVIEAAPKWDVPRIKEQSAAGASRWMAPIFEGGRPILSTKLWRLLTKRAVGYIFIRNHTDVRCAQMTRRKRGGRKCGEVLDSRLTHSSDKCNAIYTWRHNAMVKALMKILVDCGHTAQAEVNVLPEAVYRNKRLRPADILIYNWSGPGVDLIVDVVISTASRTHLVNGRSTPGMVLANAQRLKHNKYDKILERHGVLDNAEFIAFAGSTVGSFGTEAKGMVNQLVAFKAKKDLISLTAAHNIIWNLINVTLMKEVAMALRFGAFVVEKL